MDRYAHRIFLKHGGTILRSCPVKKIIVENGIAKGVLLSPKAIYPGQEVRARHAVISNVGACLTLELVGEQTVAAIDPKLAAKMKHWDMASRASTVTIWVTNGFPKWKSRHWDPMIEKAHFFYGVGWESWEGVKQWYRALRNNDLWGAFGRFGEMVIPAAVDPSQMSPEGYVSIRCEEVLPFWWQGEGAEPDLWDDAKDAMLEKRTDFLEQLAPGFKEQVVEAIHCTPLDVWRYNPSGVHGNGIGGAFTSEQWMFDRMPYRMPIKALYSSNSVWPASMSYMASGYNAACVVAEDMGIRKQPWWVHRPVEWFLKNRARIAARP